MSTPGRRRFILGSGALLALPGFSRTTFSQAPALRVPVVDSLVVRVVTDSSYDTPKPPAHPLVRVRRAAFGGRPDFRKALHNEWGLALALESRIGNETRSAMLDFGYTPQAYLNNLELIGIDPAKAQTLILSHGHFDHFGGLIGYLEKYRSRLPADLALYVGGEDNFCNRKTGSPGGHFSDWGVLDRRELEKHNVRIVKCEQPTVMHGHAFSTGNIPRRSFERVFPNTTVSYRRGADGVGCHMPAEDAKAGGAFVQDQHWNEHATCYHVKDRGLVVISSCGHAGIVNSVLQAMQVSGVKDVHAVMGGFHLFPAADDYLRRVVDEMNKLDVDAIIPLHCSGPGLVAMARAVSPDKLLTSTTGTEFTFGA